MLSSAIPTKFPIPFGASANPATIRVVPQASQIGIQDGAASLTDGFPIKTQTPIGAGGTPPWGQDMNGILFQSTAWLQWVNAGAPIKYDAAFQTAIGGYPKGAVVQSAVTVGVFWFSLTENNVTNPDAAGAGWTTLCRIRLNAALTVYVATTGSDSVNTGLTIGSPFLTIQHAYQYIANLYDLNGNAATIQVADGTYNAGVTITTPCVGGGVGAVTVNGNNATPANVVINNPGGNAYIVSGPGCSLTITNQKIQGSYGVVASSSAAINLGAGIIFGPCTNDQISAGYNSLISIGADYSIVGGALHHMTASLNAVLNFQPVTITLTGTPTFSGAYANASGNGTIQSQTLTFSGGALGTYYTATQNGVIITSSGNPAYFPGSSAGSTSTGGQYS